MQEKHCTNSNSHSHSFTKLRIIDKVFPNDISQYYKGQLQKAHYLAGFLLKATDMASIKSYGENLLKNNHNIYYYSIKISVTPGTEPACQCRRHKRPRFDP